MEGREHGGAILEAFSRLSRDRGAKTAVIALSESRHLSFAELADEARAMALALRASRLSSGDVVLSQAGNRVGFLTLLIACLELGLVLIPVDAEATPAEARGTAERYRASAWIAATHVADGEHDKQIELPSRLSLLRLSDEREPFDLGDTVLLKLTSGSTNQPRAVMVSEHNLWSDGQHVIEAMNLRPGDVNLGVIPLAHSYGLGNLVLPLFLQGTCLALRDRFALESFPADVVTSEGTVLPAVPFLFERLESHHALDHLPPSLRLLVTAGAPLDNTMADRFQARFGLKIHSFYGTSETGGISYDASDDLHSPTDVGLPLPGTEVTLRPCDIGDAPGFGRVHVRSHAVSRGYAAGPAGDVADFVDGGFLTSDLGHWTDKGRLALAGRVSWFVNVAGRKVNPAEIERVLEEHPAVAHARVLGVPCATRGEKVVACVVPRAVGIDEIEIRAHCAERLSAFKIPRQFVFVESLPIDSRGKTGRLALQQMVRARMRPNGS